MFGEGTKNRLNPAKRDILRKKLERTASFPKKLFLGISPRRLILPPISLRAAPAGAASNPLLPPTKNQEVQFCALCLKMREPSLSETDAPPRRRSLRSLFRKKVFFAIFYFARPRFFLLKGKENFFAELCSCRAGRRGFASARERRNSPHTPLPPRPRFRRRFFRRA